MKSEIERLITLHDKLETKIDQLHQDVNYIKNHLDGYQLEKSYAKSKPYKR